MNRHHSAGRQGDLPPTGADAADFYPQINKLIVADTGSPVEMTVRYLSVCLGTLIFVALTGVLGLLVWLAIYLAINLGYLFYLLRVQKPATRAQLRWAEALNIVSALAFMAVMPLLWISGGTAERMVAAALLIAQLIFNVSRHGANRTVMIWDAVSVSGMALFLAYDLTGPDSPPATQVAIVFVVLPVAAYYITVLRDNFAASRKHEADVARMVQANRLEAVGELTAGIAHDFNNILTAVMGHLELAGATDDPRDQRASLNAAHDAASRAARLTAQLASFARKSPMAVARHDLSSLLAGVCAVADGLMPRHIALWPDLTAEVPPVDIDAARCETAVFNLLTNARNASGDSGGIHLTLNRTTLNRSRRLTWGGLPSPGRYAVIMVEDRGTGMPPATLQRAVEPFFSGKGLGQGSGLGLAVVKGFAEQSGGGLAMSSTPGIGTVATLYLPIPAELPHPPRPDAP